MLSLVIHLRHSRIYKSDPPPNPPPQEWDFGRDAPLQRTIHPLQGAFQALFFVLWNDRHYTLADTTLLRPSHIFSTQ